LKYDISVDPKEIIDSLKSSKKKDNESILWQTYNDSRNVFQIYDIEIDELRSLVHFSIKEENAFVDLARIAYIKLAHRNTIFKGDVLKITASNVIMSIPDEVQLEEFREFSRYHFDFKENRSININIQSEFMTNTSANLKVQLMDMSVKGLGILSSMNNKDLILNSNSLYLSSLGDYNLPVEILMEIAHSSDHHFRSEGKGLKLFKFGTKLEQHLEESLINDFMDRIEGRHQDEVGFLAIDDKLQSRIHEEMNRMFNSLNKGVMLSKLMKAQKSESYSRADYLKEHMRLLCKVSCGIASELGLYDKKTIKNLTYAAYTHDVAYFNEPKLALIKNDQHFLKIKDKLSKEDVRMYKRSQDYFKEFVSFDTTGSRVAIKIVEDFYNMRNRELVYFTPDYSTLSCVFMVSHHLVDYIILRKRWSFYDYLEVYPEKFNGGTFDLIYDALQTARLTSDI
jgi:HD-GYP domain-containing protein (c-di-GMP phosphodiesterase class II)